jgi:hypothetical protein
MPSTALLTAQRRRHGIAWVVASGRKPISKRLYRNNTKFGGTRRSRRHDLELASVLMIGNRSAN